MFIDRLFSDPLSLLAYLLLLAAIVSLWLPKQPLNKAGVWPWLLLVAVGVAGIAGRIELEAVAAIVMLLIGFFISLKSKQAKIIRLLFGVFAVALSVILALHRFPGFNNWQVVDALLLGDSNAVFSLYLNFDKPVVGLILLTLGPSLLFGKRAWLRAFKPVLPVLLATPFVIYSMSYCAGFVVLDPKLPAITPLWLLSNLLVTCVAEEAFFRGFLQRQLQHKLQGYSWGAVVSLSVVSLLFGVAHLSGGFSYAMIAAVAGLFYGYVYQKSGAIETSIALHFLVNAGHFILLSYPRLA